MLYQLSYFTVSFGRAKVRSFADGRNNFKKKLDGKS